MFDEISEEYIITKINLNNSRKVAGILWDRTNILSKNLNSSLGETHITLGENSSGNEFSPREYCNIL